MQPLELPRESDPPRRAVPEERHYPPFRCELIASSLPTCLALVMPMGDVCPLGGPRGDGYCPYRPDEYRT